jgi:hypothetical protein
MGIEGHPFLTNIVTSSFQQGKFEVLTSDIAREPRQLILKGRYQLMSIKKIGRNKISKIVDVVTLRLPKLLKCVGVLLLESC